MKRKDLLDINLSLFDGAATGGGDGTGAAASGQAGDSAKGGSQAAPGSTRRGKSTGEFGNVLFGKQETPAAAGGDSSRSGTGQQQSSVAGSDNKEGVTTTSDALEDKRRAFQELVNGEYKDVYTEETQRIIYRPFREPKNMEHQESRKHPVIDMLMHR